MKVTTQKVHAVLQKAGHKRAKWVRSGRGQGWGHWTAGYKVLDCCGQIEVSHVSGGWRPEGSSGTPIERYRAALQAAGIAFAIDGEGIVIPIEQPEPEGS